MLIPQLQSVFQCAYTTFATFRFKLNFTIGKGNAIVRIAGPGSEPVRQQLQADKFTIQCACGPPNFSVVIVDAYQHLGRILTPDLSLKTDIDSRNAQCRASLAPIAHRYFRQADIPMVQKIQVARSHLLSILCVGSSGWHVMRPAETKLFHQKAISIWRPTTSSFYKERLAAGLAPLADQELLDHFELLAHRLSSPCCG